MSQAQIEKFYAAAVKDPEMVAGLIRQNEKGDTFDEDGFVRSAVAKARELGYEFSHEEAQAWIRKQQEAVASGELSDTQLEAVAGGTAKALAIHGVNALADLAKDKATDVMQSGLVQGGKSFGIGMYETGAGMYQTGKGAVTSAVNFFKSW